jgi:hypothetical protein
MADTVFNADMGGGKQSAGAPIPNIGDTPDTEVAPAQAEGAMADGEPVSPTLASRRYGAAAGQGYHTNNPDPGAP